MVMLLEINSFGWKSKKENQECTSGDYSFEPEGLFRSWRAWSVIQTLCPVVRCLYLCTTGHWTSLTEDGVMLNQLANNTFDITVGIRKQDVSGFRMVNLGPVFEWFKNKMAAKALA